VIIGDNLLTVKEASEYLKVHWQTVRNYIRKGNLKSAKVGRNLRIRQSEVERFIKRKSRSQDRVEIEIRFIIKNRKKLEKRLFDLGAKLTYHSHVIDHWYNPAFIKNMKQKEEFYDSAKGYGLRIREQDNGYTGKVQTSLEVKKLLIPNKHDTCLEAEIDISDYEEANSLLRLMNYREVIKIDKDRVVYKHKDYKIVIDDVKDFKTGVEIEILTDQKREKIIPRLKILAKKLCLDLEKEMTDKSITYMAMKKFRKF
jgi:predicted adenylyl cyclase CyaB